MDGSLRDVGRAERRLSPEQHSQYYTYRAQVQTHSMVVRWKATYTSGTNAGIYLWASSSSGAERGNSYRIWQDATTVRISRTPITSPRSGPSFAASNAAGQTHSYVARDSPINGAIQV